MQWQTKNAIWPQVAAMILLAASGGAEHARAEVVRLTNGGELEATVRYDSELASDGEVELVLAGGGSIVLPRAQIARVESTGVTQDDYFQKASYFADSAQEQWKLAQWCKGQGLQLPFERHAARVLELEPDFAPARQALGYQNRGGRWVSREEILRERGYVRYEGRWVTMQQAALLHSRDVQQQKIINWKVRLHRWRKQLGQSSQSVQSGAPGEPLDVTAITDPDAVAGLIDLLGEETDRHLALGYLEILGQIGSARAVRFLMEHAIYQNHPEFREACLKEVLKRKDPKMTLTFAGYLNHYDQILVNRAAYALALLDYPEAVFPLANALKTRHLAPHSTRYTYFHTQEGAVDRFDIAGPRESYRTLSLTEFLARSRNAYDTQWMQNEGVHQALVRLCDGQDFGYDPAAWKAWYRQQHAPKAPSIRLARDE